MSQTNDTNWGESNWLVLFIKYILSKMHLHWYVFNFTIFSVSATLLYKPVSNLNAGMTMIFIRGYNMSLTVLTLPWRNRVSIFKISILQQLLSMGCIQPPTEQKYTQCQHYRANELIVSQDNVPFIDEWDNNLCTWIFWNSLHQVRSWSKDVTAI